MSNNCLKVTLAEASTNPAIREFGELRVKCLEDTENYNCNFRVASNRTIKIVDNSGTIYDGANWVANSNNNKIHATAGSIVSIPDKYSLITFITEGKDLILTENGDLEDFKYCTNLESIYQNGDRNPFKGDISSLKLLTNLKTFHQFSSLITGDFADIGDKPDLIELSLYFSKVGGNFEDVWTLAPNIEYVTGGKGYTHGNISISPAYLVRSNGNNNDCSWPAGGRVAANISHICTILDVNLGTDLDNMLVEQATLTPHTKRPNNLINVTGVHTMEEGVYNAAIATLKSKNCTVTINGVVQ